MLPFSLQMLYKSLTPNSTKTGKIIKLLVRGEKGKYSVISFSFYNISI